MMNSAPLAQKIPTERHFHGDTYVDNYEWFRAEESAEVINHLKAENAWTAQNTAHLAPAIDRLVEEYASRTEQADVTVPRKHGDWWFFQRTFEGKQYPAVYRIRDTGSRPHQSAVEAGENQELVYDGNLLAEGQEFFATSSFLASPDGKLGALGVDFLGNERFTLRIFDIETGLIIDDAVADIGYGLAWTSDSTGIVYSRFDASWRSNEVWLHTVGTSPYSDQRLLEEGDPKFDLWHVPSRDGQWIVVTSESNTTTEVRLISAGQPTSAPILVSSRTPGVEYGVEPANDHLLIVHNANTPDFEIATAPIRTSNPADWVPVLKPEPGERIEGVEAFRDFVVVKMRSEGETALKVARRNGPGSSVPSAGVSIPSPYQEPHERSAWGEFVRLPSPPLSTIDMCPAYDWDTGEFQFTVESILTPKQTHVFTVEGGGVELIKQVRVPNFDPEAYVQEGVWVEAADGTSVPLTVIRRRDVEPDGKNPGFIYGYGSYEVSNDPMFVARFISYLERGVVMAWTHVRGGGEMGREWYNNGKLLQKKNTFTDFVDCSKWLISSGWVHPERLAAEGRSAGGLLMGACANLAPETFRAIHAGVPFVDSLTTILNPDLPLTAGEWEEWGNPITDPEVYEYMKSYSPTENVTAKEYPAILTTTSLNDIRVSYVEPTKWVQILRETTLNDQKVRPILEQIEMVAGHGGKPGRYDKWRQEAFVAAWILDQIGAA